MPPKKGRGQGKGRGPRGRIGFFQQLLSMSSVVQVRATPSSARLLQPRPIPCTTINLGGLISGTHYSSPRTSMPIFPFGTEEICYWACLLAPILKTCFCPRSSGNI